MTTFLIVLLLTLLCFFILTFTGWSICAFILPEELKKYDLLIAPLIGTSVITLLVNFNYIGIPTIFSAWFLIALSVILAIAAFIKGIRPDYKTIKENWVLFAVIAVIFTITTIPLLKYGLTTLSNRNPDVYHYVSVAEHIKTKTLNNITTYQKLNPDSTTISRVAKLKWSVATEFFISFLGTITNIPLYRLFPIVGIIITLLTTISIFLVVTACFGLKKETGYFAAALLSLNSFVLFIYYHGALNNLNAISLIPLSIGFTYLALENKSIKYLTICSIFLSTMLVSYTPILFFIYVVFPVFLYLIANTIIKIKPNFAIGLGLAYRQADAKRSSVYRQRTFTLIPIIILLTTLFSASAIYRFIDNSIQSIKFANANYTFDWYKPSFVEAMGITARINDIKHINYSSYYIFTAIFLIALISIFCFFYLIKNKKINVRVKIYLYTLSALFFAYSIYIGFVQSNNYTYTKNLSYISFLPAIILAIGFNGLLNKFKKDKTPITYFSVVFIVIFLVLRLANSIQTMNPVYVIRTLKSGASNTTVLEPKLTDLDKLQIPKNKTIALVINKRDWWTIRWMSYFLRNNKITIQYPNEKYFLTATPPSPYSVPYDAFKTNSFDYILSDSKINNFSVKWTNGKYYLFNVKKSRLYFKRYFSLKSNEPVLFIPIIPENTSSNIYYSILTENNINKKIEPNKKLLEKMFLSAGINNEQYKILKRLGVETIIFDYQTAKKARVLKPEFTSYILKKSPYLKESRNDDDFKIFKLRAEPLLKIKKSKNNISGIFLPNLNSFYIGNNVIKLKVAFQNTSSFTLTGNKSNNSYRKIKIACYLIDKNHRIASLGSLDNYSTIKPNEIGYFNGILKKPGHGVYTLRYHLVTDKGYSSNIFYDNIFRF